MRFSEATKQPRGPHDDQFESALSDLAARLAGTDATLSTSLRDILTVALQELIEAELTGLIGAAPGERTAERTAQRNGHRPKLLSTPAGDVEVGIPKLRTGSFFPELLEPRRRVDRALWAVIMTAYITGTSTRKVDDLVTALGCDSGVSTSTVSRTCRCAGIDADVAVLRTRRLDHQPFVSRPAGCHVLGPPDPARSSSVRRTGRIWRLRRRRGRLPRLEIGNVDRRSARSSTSS